MAVPETISQNLPDGTVEVWLDGWHISFPPDGGQPTIERASSPMSPQHPTAGLTASPFGPGYSIRHGSWIVALTESDFTVIPTEPEENEAGDHRQYYYFE